VKAVVVGNGGSGKTWLPERAANAYLESLRKEMGEERRRD
jgi:GTPase SAR1 family protein